MFGGEIFGNSLLIIYEAVKNLHLTVVNPLELGLVEIHIFLWPHRVFEILMFVDLHTDIKFSKPYTTINTTIDVKYLAIKILNETSLFQG